MTYASLLTQFRLAAFRKFSSFDARLGIVSAAFRSSDGGVFELGSLTKPVVAFCLLDVIGEEGALRPLAAYLPAAAGTPLGNVPFLSLMTHSSGLPRLPSDFTPASSEQPYIGCGDDQVVADAVRSWDQSLFDAYCYSNLGYALLGLALEQITSSPLENYLADRFSIPAGVRELDGLHPGEPWVLDGYRGAGVLRATIDEAEQVFLELCRTPAMTATRLPGQTLLGPTDGRVIRHLGATRLSRSIVRFDIEQNSGWVGCATGTADPDLLAIWTEWISASLPARDEAYDLGPSGQVVAKRFPRRLEIRGRGGVRIQVPSELTRVETEMLLTTLSVASVPDAIAELVAARRSNGS